MVIWFMGHRLFMSIRLSRVMLFVNIVANYCTVCETGYSVRMSSSVRLKAANNIPVVFKHSRAEIKVYELRICKVMWTLCSHVKN